MSKEFKINLLEEMDLLYAKIHRLEDVCEQANIMLNQRDEIEEGLNKRIAELEALVNVSEGLYERIYEQAARIAELEAERRWIPVSERLPEDTERMLTIVYDAFEDTTAISILQHYGDGDWFSWDSGRYVVTHWMPLPELPKECER